MELRALLEQAGRKLSADIALLLQFSDAEPRLQLAVGDGAEAHDSFAASSQAVTAFMRRMAAGLLPVSAGAAEAVAVRSFSHPPIRFSETMSLRHSLVLLLRVDLSTAWLLSFHRADARPAFAAEDERQAGAMRPWLGSCLAFWYKYWLENARASGLEASLNGQDLSTLLLDRKARIIFANHEARILLQEGDGLRRAGAQVTAANLADGVLLQTAISLAISRQAEAARSIDGSSLVCIRRAGGRRPLTVAAIGTERPPLRDSDPAVMLYVTDPERKLDHAIDAACEIYRLTPTEVRLTRHLVTGLTLAEAAKQMQIKADVARGYLKRIFLKTGTNRQADLIRLMLASRARSRTRLGIPSVVEW